MAKFAPGDKVKQTSDRFKGLPDTAVVLNVIGEDSPTYELDFGDTLYPFYFREDELTKVKSK
ncbi:hypothetical protein G646_gp042 [Serratia phage phiMAM1]|uniref:Uncharacterized protein n=2 Tax=Miltonvirus MAM1 TaxID=2169689 RepID=K7YXT0_9CAUD|nr:hypothetical protein G646_gp042 [Serratia phage phiMAM1]AFX93510.1 hypothetical protein MAM_042 [Serratia phage phiMAM1]ASZ78813.1 hypothetical protein 2050H1_047 [Serratia phage 2050H1]